MKYKKIVINFIDKLSGLYGWLAGIMMVVALVLAVAEIVCRTGFSGTLYITDEYGGYLMAMLTFGGLAYTLRERSHIRVMILPHFLKDRARLIFHMCCFVFGFAFCIAFTWFTYQFFWDSYVNVSKSMHVSETYLANIAWNSTNGSSMMALPFFFLMLPATVLLTVFPQIALFLSGMMK